MKLKTLKMCTQLSAIIDTTLRGHRCIGRRYERLTRNKAFDAGIIHWLKGDEMKAVDAIARCLKANRLRVDR